MRMHMILAAALALFATATAGAQSGAGKSANIAGAWQVTVTGPAAHGDMTATMNLKQDGSKVTGTFAAHGTEHQLKGQFADGELELESTDTPADKSLTFNAKLKEDGTLAGYLSSPMGDMQWTAARAAR